MMMMDHPHDVDMHFDQDFLYDFAELMGYFPEVEGRNSPTILDDDVFTDIEGKLYIYFKNLRCRGVKKRWYQKFICTIAVNGFEQKISLRASGRDTYDAEEVAIFDIYEYFGPSKISITIQCSSSSKFTYETTLHSICRQQQDNTSVSNESVESMENHTADFPHELFWKIRDGIVLEQSLSKKRFMNKYPVTCDAHFTYTDIKSYVAADGHSFRSAVQHGSEEILCDILESLSRNNLLRRALSIRTPYNNRDDVGHELSKRLYLPLEHALIVQNKKAVEVLLKRCGNWCFQSTSASYDVRNSVKWPETVQQNESIVPNFLSRRLYHSSYHICLSRTKLLPSTYCDSASPIGCAIHAAVIGGDVDSLHMVLRFVSKYHSGIVGWHAENYQDVMNWIGSRTDGYTPLMLACALGRTSCIQLLLREGASLDTASKPYRLTPLMLACSSGSLESVIELMSHLENVDSSFKGNLKAKMEKNTVALMKCSPYAVNIDGKQALGIAAEAGHAHIVEYLIENKMEFWHKDIYGSTALHLAAANGHSDVCKVIIKAHMDALLLYCRRNGKLSRESVTDYRSESDKVQMKKESISKKGGDCSVAKNESRIEPPNLCVVSEQLYQLPSTDKSIHRSRVLIDMTPRPGILNALDMRGRSASKVAEICGHSNTLSILREGEVEQVRCSDAYFKRSSVDNLRNSTPESKYQSFSDEVDEAIDMSYKFAKTMYFDPYDSYFIRNEDLDESDSEGSLSS